MLEVSSSLQPSVFTLRRLFMIRVMEIQWINLQGKKGFENIFTSVKPEMRKYIVFNHDDYDDDDED